MGMDSGSLDRRIQVQLNTPVNDAAGDPIPVWTDLAKRWARKIEVIQSESVGDGQVQRQGDTVWVLRWDDESLSFYPESHRFVHDGRIYEIVGKAEAGGREDGVRFVTCYRPDGRGARGPDNG